MVVVLVAVVRRESEGRLSWLWLWEREGVVAAVGVGVARRGESLGGGRVAKEGAMRGWIVVVGAGRWALR
jgi:hypothetical protein